MAILTPVSDNVYNISYADDQFNPMEAKMGEGTTGQKYASNYMGARSRWWDLSWRQAELEAEGIAAHNKKINDEILMLKDARANIIQGIPQRYDSMYKHHNLQEQKRAEWNASSGTMWSTTTTTGGGGGGYGARGAGAKSQAIRAQVQKAMEGSTSPDARAGNLELYRTVGDLGRDEPSQDQTAWFAVQIRSQNLMNERMNADATLTKEDAATKAEADALAEFEGSATGKDIAKRYKKHQAALIAGAGGGPRVSKTSRKGKETIQPYGKTALERLIGPLGDGFNPWVHAEETEISRIDKEVLALEGKLQDARDMIGRTRDIQRDKFGPSILGSIREMIDTRYGEQQQEGYSALEEYLQKAKDAGRLEQALAELRGLGPGQVIDKSTARYTLGKEDFEKPREDFQVNYDLPDGQSVEVGPHTLRVYNSDGEVIHRAIRDGKGGYDNILEWIQMNPKKAKPRSGDEPWTPEPEKEFEFDPESTDVAQARDALEAAEKRYDAAQMSTAGTPEEKQEMEDADTYLRAVRAWAESIGAAEKTGAEESLKRQSEEAKSKEVEEKGDGEAALLEGMGNDEVVANRRGLLKAFSGAGELLGKQKKMKRKVANAPTGSPEAYAAASMQAWRSQTPEQRSTLSDMISQTATEFNSMDDPKGAEEASKWLTALYAQETGLNLLKG